MDHGLGSTEGVTPQIMSALEETALLVVVLSPGYVESEWCRRECNAFLAAVRDMGSRVLVIERDAVDEAKRPAELRDLKPIRFWVADESSQHPRVLGWPVPSPTRDFEYYCRLDDASREVAAALRRLVRPPPQRHSPVRTVYLGLATDDLDPQRNGIRRFLEQSGIDVLPATQYSLDPNQYRAAARADLPKSKLFVQLLSAAAGKKPPDLPGGYLELETQLAREAKVPILQWRSPYLDIDAVEDPGQRALLAMPTVQAEELEEFKREIVRRIEQQPKRPARHDKSLVFVDLEEPDGELAMSLCNLLKRLDVDHTLPARVQDPAELRQDLHENLLSCDGVLVVYSGSNVTWVRRRLLECRKVLSRRDAPLRAFALCDGPPPAKPDLGLHMANLKILNCRGGITEDELHEFLADLETGNDP